jgi:hypothetical protein
MVGLAADLHEYGIWDFYRKSALLLEERAGWTMRNWTGNLQARLGSVSGPIRTLRT